MTGVLREIMNDWAKRNGLTITKLETTALRHNNAIRIICEFTSPTHGYRTVRFEVVGEEFQKVGETDGLRRTIGKALDHGLNRSDP